MNCVLGKLYRDADGKLRQAFYYNGELMRTEPVPAPQPSPQAER